MLKVITYRPRIAESVAVAALDVGLPKYPLSLVQIPALEVTLCWLQKHARSQEVTLQDNRLQLVRFILCWHLTVPDAAKASAACFKTLKGELFGALFPEKQLIEVLVKQQLALPIRSPEELMGIITLPIRITRNQSQICGLTHSRDVNGLRGWRHFVADTEGLAKMPNEIDGNRRRSCTRKTQRTMSPGFGIAVLKIFVENQWMRVELQARLPMPRLPDAVTQDMVAKLHLLPAVP